MDATDFIILWKEQYQKIDQALVINKQLLIHSLEGKAKLALRNVKPVRWTGIIFGIFWCLAVGFVLIVSWGYTNWFFKTALVIHLLVSVAAIGLYIYHLILLQNFNNSQNVVHAQKQLIKLQHSNLKTLGLLWLQLPVFSMWFMSNEWMQNSPVTFWLIQVPVVLLQFFAGVWLYKNLNFKNHQKKWFKWFVSKGEFGKINKANALLQEIDALEKN